MSTTHKVSTRCACGVEGSDYASGCLRHEGRCKNRFERLAKVRQLSAGPIIGTEIVEWADDEWLCSNCAAELAAHETNKAVLDKFFGKLKRTL